MAQAVLKLRGVRDTGLLSPASGALAETIPLRFS
jgi:hypothetical protein